MARKTLGKMEFEQLIDSLKEQNKGQLAAQQETTKSIQNLQAYFLKQDRAETRRRLEDQMEQRKDAEKVPGKQKGLFDKKIPTKGIFGKLMDFFLTGALGTASKGLFRSLWSGVKFKGGFFKGLAGFMGGLLLAPGVWDSIKKGLDKEESFAGKMDVIFSEFIKNNDFVSTVTGGALVGTMFGGPKGAIAGAMIGAGLSLVGSALGKDETIGDIFTGDVSPLLTGGLGLAGGALAGAKLGASVGGVRGLVLGALIGGALGGVGGVFASKDMTEAIGRNPLKFMMLSAGGAVLGSMAGFKAGAAIGMVGGPLGMLFGGLVGLLLGSLATYFLDKHFQSKVERRGKIKSLDNQILEMQKALEEEGKTGKGPKYRAKEKKLRELALRRKIVASLQAGEIEKGDVNADLEGIVLKDEQQLARKILKEESDAIQVEFSKSDAAEAQREDVRKTTEASIEASGSQDLAFYLREYLQRKLDNNEQINANENTKWKNWVPKNMQSIIEEVGPNNHHLTHSNLHLAGGQIVKMFRDQQRLKKINLRPEDRLARGYGAYSPGSMQTIMVGDQPTAQGQELVLTEKKFNRIINDIILKNGLKRDKKDLKLEMTKSQEAPHTTPQLNQVDDQPKSERPELVLTEKNFNRIINDIILNNGIKRDREDMNIGMANSQELPLSIPQIKQIDDQPTAQGQELVLTEKKFNRIINDIMENNRLKHDKEDMNISMARSQGAPPIMPQVTNNNVSNQNVLQTEIMPSFNFDIMRDALPA